MHVESASPCVLLACFVLFLMLKDSTATPGHYTPTWSVHIEGGKRVADRVAAELGFVNLGQIIEDHYHFHHTGVVKRSSAPSHRHNNRLNNHSKVKWMRQERILSRKKRDFLPITIVPTDAAKASTVSRSPSQLSNSSNETSQVSKSTDRDNSDRSDRDLTSAERRNRYTIPITMDSQFPLNDQRWSEMWYLNRGGGLDMNVVEAWKEGITGRGIVVTILDDGLEKDHPDLLANYDAQASYDVNNHDEDPMPRYDMIDSNRHGTRCAGEVAATANNTLCAVGIAFGASVGGVRMLDGDVTDAVEARSLSLNPQHIDIYSASWGPDDDGKTVDGPGEMATRAFIEGVTKGRNGKGSIFVWASGNGGNEHDNCNCDGYTNSIWTLSISSATENGEVPWYSEMCSSTLATTYSSGSAKERQVVTTDLHHSCTSSHTGTSASAPLAAGICALALEANRELTWRDMQHIVVRTAKPANLQTSTWRINGVGRNVSHSFGYGLMDAAAMIKMAQVWKTVPPQHRCEVSAPHTDKSIPPKSQAVLQLVVAQCVGVNYLEHVQAKISLTATRRGDLEINLTSPAGTRITLLAPRSHDTSRAGFKMWPFMSVHTWGESPYGQWQLEIHNHGKFMGRAMLQDWSLIFYGTASPADKNDPSPYNNIHHKINIPPPVLVPSVAVTSNKNKNKNNPKGQGNVASPFVINMNSNPRKNKNLKSSHRNSQGKNKSSVKPTVTSLRGITNKTSMYNKQYGNAKGPQRQTDSRQSLNAFKSTIIFTSTTTDKPKYGTTISDFSKILKSDKTTKPSKINNLETQPFVQTAKIQKNVSKQPTEIDNSKASQFHGNLKKSDTRITEKYNMPTTKMYPSAYDDSVTNPPNFQGYIFIDQPPEGHIGLINPKIPSLLQKYPKVQHIYPALFPYPKVDVVASKPSRQHPSLSQFHPEHYVGGLVSQDSIDIEMNKDHHQSRLSDAQLTQWDLIFYGTEVPPQGELDYNRFSKPDILDSGAELGIGEGEVGQHNSLENDRMVEKWRDTKVRDEGRIEHQSKMEFNSDTRSGCLSQASPPSTHCIECHQEFYLFAGQCYKTCPERTFPSKSFSISSHKPKTAEVLGTVEEVSTSLRKKRKKAVRRAALKHSMKFGYASRDIMRPEPPKICIECHYSCLTCSGPYNYQCTNCPGDAKLVSNLSGKVKEIYCYPSFVFPEIEGMAWVNRFSVVFGIVIFIICSVLMYFFVSCVILKCRKKSRDNTPLSVVSYNRLQSIEDPPSTSIDVKKDTGTALYEDSDSEG